VELTGEVAVRLASLCLERSGRLRDYALWDTATRGALLVDLALAGRLTLTEDSVAVDETPTGFGPADALLAAIAVEPERSLDWWLDHGGVALADVAAAAVAGGRWAVHRLLFRRRYTDLWEERADADRVRASGSPDDTWTPSTAAVVAIAAAAGAGGRRPRPPDDELLAATGPLRWICQAVTDHLQVAHARNRLGASAADGVAVDWP
jgi:hypothetical protein